MNKLATSTVFDFEISTWHLIHISRSLPGGTMRRNRQVQAWISTWPEVLTCQDGWWNNSMDFRHLYHWFLLFYVVISQVWHRMFLTDVAEKSDDSVSPCLVFVLLIQNDNLHVGFQRILSHHGEQGVASCWWSIMRPRGQVGEHGMAKKKRCDEVMKSFSSFLKKVPAYGWMSW